MLMGTFALGILVGVAFAAFQAYRVKKKKAREQAAASAAANVSPSDHNPE